MKTTTSGRAFAKGMFDIFSTLMVSLRIENRKIRWRSYPNSFTAEGAIGNLGNLQVTQSNRESDPNDPTRIITHVTTTQFSLSRDMSRNLCQTFMDARLLECATDSSKREFQSRGLYQVTPKGAYLLAKFVVRNKLPIGESRHITANSATNLVFLEREENEDAIILTEKQVDIIFKRFAGPEPNTARTDPGADSPMSSMSSTAEAKYRAPFVMDLSNGVEVKDQQFNSETYKDTFYGKAAVEWLLDYSTVISKEEAICICQEMVNARYIEQVGEENTNGPSIFKTGNSALYHLTETGRALAGWKSLDDCCGSIHNDWMDERSTAGSKAERSSPETNLLSTQFKLTSSNLARLPISIAQERRRSMDEVSLSTLQYNEDSNKSGPTRRLSQILNDPAFQITLSENGPMSSYAPSSSGRESVGASAGGAGSTRLSLPMSSAQSTTSNTSRLNGILSDAPVRDLFKSFLKQNFCEENLSFYFEVVDYKTKFKGLITSAKAYNISETGPEPNNMGFAYPPSLRELEKQICTQAFAIFETYLASGAPREVNLPHQMRQDITEYMQAVVRSMETSTVTTVTTPDGGNINNASLPPTPSSLPTSPSPADASDGGEKGGQKELIHISLFDLIHDHIFRLMSTDSVPKFIKTDKYLEVVMKKHKRKHAAAAAAAAAAVNSDDPLSLSLNQQDGLNGVNGKSANNGGGGGSSMANGDGVSEGNTTHAGSSRNEGESSSTVAELRR
ncbi:hypothetical protein BGZ54_006648 [Gamsiella multidivaricata]|nr:hypothetical protein BGZ54_006648 [Gamsiella multidivaricata]